jgi:hypothetical protein
MAEFWACGAGGGTGSGTCKTCGAGLPIDTSGVPGHLRGFRKCSWSLEIKLGHLIDLKPVLSDEHKSFELETAIIPD